MNKTERNNRYIREIRKMGENMLNMFYPHCCPICHRILRDQKHALICETCSSEMHMLREPLCKTCGRPVKEERETCRDCEGKKHFFQEGRAVFLYDDRMKVSILLYKNGGRREYAGFYSQAMYEYVKPLIRRWKIDLILPIPVHRKKQKERGFHHAGLLGEKLAGSLGILFSENILLKKKETKQQKELGYRERRKNLKGAFVVQGSVRGLTIMLVDDVYTTGSTMDTAAEVLLRAGAEQVYYLTLCIANPDS